MKFGKQGFALLLCTVFIAACSGSDGGSVVPPPPPASSMAKIDAGNAAPIAGQVAELVFASGSLDDIVAGESGFQVGRMDSGLSKTGGSQTGGLYGVIASAPVRMPLNASNN